MNEETQTPEDEEPGTPISFDVLPGYLVLKEGQMKDEARRIHILPFIVDDAGVLLKNWDEEAAKLEEFLKAGAPKRTTMKVVK